MSFLDHFLAAGLVFVSLVQMNANDAERQADASRRSFYSAAVGTGGGLAGLTLFFWTLQGREIAQFGLTSWLGGQGAAVAAAGWLLILLVLYAMISRGFFNQFLYPIYDRYAYVMPRTASEVRQSWGASIAAGAGEEIAYRGFLIWYLTDAIGLTAAILASSILFGLSHSYQRRFGILFASAAGLVLALIYLATDSLALAMLIHATYNMATFAAGRRVLSRGKPESRAMCKRVE